MPPSYTELITNNTNVLRYLNALQNISNTNLLVNYTKKKKRKNEFKTISTLSLLTFPLSVFSIHLNFSN